MPTRIRSRTLRWLGLAFVASRALFFALGVRLDTSRLETMWQFLDRELLRADLARSIYYLHAQPPLYNLLLGAALKIAPSRPEIVLSAVHLALGLGLTLAIAALARRLGASERASAACALLFMVSPGAVLYENFGFYTHVEAAALAGAALFLHRFASGLRARDGLAFFALAAALVLARASFHLGWLVIAAALVARGAGRRWPVVLRAAAAPVLAAALWYGKNLVVFGSFSGSTWLGMNLARVAVETLPAGDRSALVASGVLSPIARVAPFRDVAAYAPHAPRPRPRGVPALDRESKARRAPNFNHLAYVGISRRFLRDSAAAIAARPRAYLRGVETAAAVYFRAPSDYWLLASNARKIERFARPFEAVVYGRRPSRACVALYAALPIGLAFSLYGGLARRRAIGRARAITLLFMGGTIAYLTLVSTLLDAGENNRFRFPLDPLLLVLVVLALGALARRILRAIA
jgi:hypothetical protein